MPPYCNESDETRECAPPYPDPISFSPVLCDARSINMLYCVTEEMVADLLTKIVSGAQDNRLTVRFYSLCPRVHHIVVSPNSREDV